MKRILTILLIPVFILTATVGVTLNYYSCKAMTGESMAKPCCKNTGKGGCCEKESITLKIQDAFIKATNNSNLSASLYFIQEQIFSFSFVPLTNRQAYGKGHRDNAPPSPSIGFYILYGSLII
jgi:hypothetical protein